MMQLVCNNIAVDLHRDTGIQFTDENPLFAFDSLKCERTAAFKVPATTINDRLFSLARIPAYDGSGMRVKFNAELQMSGVVRRGYLYVTAWNGSAYEVVFVTGEYIGLQALRDAGSIREILDPRTGIVWAAANTIDASASVGQSVAMVRYATDAPLVNPSTDIGLMLDTVYYRLRNRHLNAFEVGYRWIPKQVVPSPKLEGIRLMFRGTGVAPTPDSSTPTDDANYLLTTGTPVIGTDFTQSVLFLGAGGNYYIWRLRQFVAKQTIILTFPANFSDNLHLMSIRGTGTADPEYNISVSSAQSWFLGGYAFSERANQSGTYTTGTPLAGRSVTIPSGTPFVIMPRNMFQWVPNGVHGWLNLSTDSGYSSDVLVDIEGESIAAGDTVRVKDLLPDMSFVELAKMYAALTGTMLYYNDADGLQFDTLDIETWGVIDITPKIMSTGEVKRTFGDYAQANRVEFESSDDVIPSQRIYIDYTIENENIDRVKTLATIPASEGAVTTRDGRVVALFTAEDRAGSVLYADGVMSTRDGVGAYGERVTPVKNDGLQALCVASTQIEVQARMSAYEYTSITPKTVIQVNGTKYVWTARNWQKDTAKFTLARIFIELFAYIKKK